MATKANERARAKVKDAERRAQRKINRLKNKGIRTGSITPFEKIDHTNTRALNEYAKRLEKFISRSNRYVAGYDGTPIEYSLYREYQQTRKQWEKRRDKFWNENYQKKIVIERGESETTLARASYMADRFNMPFGGIRKQQREDISTLKRRDLIARIDLMKRDLDPKHEEKMAKRLRQNLYSVAQDNNADRVLRKLRGMSNYQLQQLAMLTDFTETYFDYINTDQDNELGTINDAMELERMEEHMLLLIDNIKKLYPNRKVPKPKGKHRRKRKK